MIVKITDYIVEGETKLCSDVLEVNVNLQKTGDDFDVITMWIRDEVVNSYGVDILPTFKIVNRSELEASMKEVSSF